MHPPRHCIGFRDWGCWSANPWYTWTSLGIGGGSSPVFGVVTEASPARSAGQTCTCISVSALAESITNGLATPLFLLAPSVSSDFWDSFCSLRTIKGTLEAATMAAMTAFRGGIAVMYGESSTLARSCPVESNDSVGPDTMWVRKHKVLRMALNTG
eukprot:4491873-Pyramimonas_sp.AAC.1